MTPEEEKIHCFAIEILMRRIITPDASPTIESLESLPAVMLAAATLAISVGDIRNAMEFTKLATSAIDRYRDLVLKESREHLRLMKLAGEKAFTAATSGEVGVSGDGESCG